MKISDSSFHVNRNYEFEVELEDHQLENKNIYRLYYINYHRIDEHYGRTDNNVGVIDWPFKPFMLPYGMSREDFEKEIGSKELFKYDLLMRKAMKVITGE